MRASKIELEAVSTRAPVKGRREAVQIDVALARFNSRPCEGATGVEKLRRVVKRVSTRAPVKGRRATAAPPGAPSRFQLAPL